MKPVILFVVLVMLGCEAEHESENHEPQDMIDDACLEGSWTIAARCYPLRKIADYYDDNHIRYNYLTCVMGAADDILVALGDDEIVTASERRKISLIISGDVEDDGIIDPSTVAIVERYAQLALDSCLLDA